MKSALLLCDLELRPQDLSPCLLLVTQPCPRTCNVTPPCSCLHHHFLPWALFMATQVLLFLENSPVPAVRPLGLL